MHAAAALMRYFLDKAPDLPTALRWYVAGENARKQSRQIDELVRQRMETIGRIRSDGVDALHSEEDKSALVYGAR